MSESAEIYYGAFCKLVKEDDGDVMTPDQNAIRIGAPLEISAETHVTQRGKEYDRVFVHDAAGRNAGFLPKQMAKKVIGLFDAGWLCHAIPTLVVYSKKDEGYWAEIALVCYAKEHRESFDVFLSAACKRFAAGDHVDVRLSDKQVERVVEEGGSFSAFSNAPLPNIDKNSAIYKSRQSGTEKLATTAIEHTAGCYVVLIAATLVVVAIVVWFFFLRG